MSTTEHPGTRRDGLVMYLILALAITWVGSGLYYWTTPAGGTRLPPGLGLPAALIWYYGPCLAAIIVSWYQRRGPGVKALFAPLRVWRVGWPWYAFVVLYPLALHLVVVGLGWLAGGPAPRFFATEFVGQQLPGGSLVATFLILLVSQIVLRGIGEETGWRGFALPRLIKRFGALQGSLVLGLMWALWHFNPANLSHLLTVNGLLSIGNYVATAVVFTWLYLHTRGSLWMAILFHATLNLAEWVVPIGALEGGLRPILIQLLVLWGVVGVLVKLYGPDLGLGREQLLPAA